MLSNVLQDPHDGEWGHRLAAGVFSSVMISSHVGKSILESAFKVEWEVHTDSLRKDLNFHRWRPGVWNDPWIV